MKYCGLDAGKMPSHFCIVDEERSVVREGKVRNREAEQMNLAAKPKRRRASRQWATLMARIFETLPLLCTCCGLPMRMIAFITEPKIITRILDHLGEPSRPPPLSPARAPPELDFDYLPA